jgi:hypothetical protein
LPYWSLGLPKLNVFEESKEQTGAHDALPKKGPRTGGLFLGNQGSPYSLPVRDRSELPGSAITSNL